MARSRKPATCRCRHANIPTNSTGLRLVQLKKKKLVGKAPSGQAGHPPPAVKPIIHIITSPLEIYISTNPSRSYFLQYCHLSSMPTAPLQPQHEIPSISRFYLSTLCLISNNHFMHSAKGVAQSEKEGVYLQLGHQMSTTENLPRSASRKLPMTFKV